MMIGLWLGDSKHKIGYTPKENFKKKPYQLLITYW